MKSQTAEEYREREAYLRLFASPPNRDCCGPAELVYHLEALGVGLDDVDRLFALATIATDRRLPGTIDDACSSYRIGIIWLNHRGGTSGTVIGTGCGYQFVAWST